MTGVTGMKSDADLIIGSLRDGNADAAIIVNGSADDAIARLLEAGWTLEDKTKIVAGKRIRYIRPPATTDN